MSREVSSTKKDFFDLSKDLRSTIVNKEQIILVDKKIESINTSLNSLEDVRSEIMYVKKAKNFLQTLLIYCTLDTKITMVQFVFLDD